jgi:hypothetical protein
MASPGARRMLPRLSPLVTALLVGALPWLAVVLPLSIWSTPLDSFVLQTVLHAIVVAVVGLWVLRRSPASLLPITAFLVLAYAVPSLVVFWAGPRFAVGESVDWLILGLHWALALALIVQGRMWRWPNVSRAESLAAGGAFVSIPSDGQSVSEPSGVAHRTSCVICAILARPWPPTASRSTT